MNNSIKRAQSQACLGFAERKNFRPLAKLKKLTLMLVALLTATGAWAQTQEHRHSGPFNLEILTPLGLNKKKNSHPEVSLNAGAKIVIKYETSVLRNDMTKDRFHDMTCH